MERALEENDQDLISATKEDLRSYLLRFKGKSDSSFSNVVKTLRRFYRDFLGSPKLVDTFQIIKTKVKPKILPSREDLQTAYASLNNSRDRALFLLYATTGLRRDELRSLKMADLDWDKKMIVVGTHNGQTKRSWITFYNQEASNALEGYLKERPGRDDRLFTTAETTISRMFKQIKEMGIHLTPQVLREWFCQEMGELGVPDRFIDAFCGRVPGSVLARHYSDYSPQRLKRIYDDAGLRVMCF